MSNARAHGVELLGYLAVLDCKPRGGGSNENHGHQDTAKDARELGAEDEGDDEGGQEIGCGEEENGELAGQGFLYRRHVGGDVFCDSADAECVEETHVLADDGFEICSAHTANNALTTPVETDCTDIYADEYTDGDIDIVKGKSRGFGMEFRHRN